MFICSICTNDLDGHRDVPVSAPCGHVFHKECVFQWLEKSPTCPYCRECLTYEQVKILHFHTPEVQDDLTKLKKDYDLSQDEIETLEDRVQRSQNTITFLEESREALLDHGQKLSNINLFLKSKLQHFSYVQQLILCSEVDFKNILEIINKEPDALQKMVCYCTLLKKQLSMVLESERQLRSSESSEEKGFSLSGELDDINLLKRQILTFEKENGIIYRNQPQNFINIKYMNDVTKYLSNVLNDFRELKDGFSDLQFQHWIETQLRLMHGVTVGKKTDAF